MVALQVRRTTTYVIPATFTDVTLDTTDIENLPDIVEHDDVNTDRILIKKDGIYLITWNFSIETGATDERYEMRVRKNDTTVINGSLKGIDDGNNNTFGLGHTFYADLSAGDYISFQVRAATASVGTIEAPTNGGLTVTVSKIEGLVGNQGWQGEQGPFGGPQGALGSQGFQGFQGIQGNSSFGSEFQQASSDSQSSTTSSSWQQKLRLTTGNLPSGTYRIGWYCEFWQSNRSDAVQVQVQIDDTTTIMSVENEPKDLHDRFGSGGFYYASLSGVTQIDMDYRQQRGSTAYIRRARIEIWRVA